MSFMCVVNDTIFRVNEKAIIGLFENARRISSLIKSNFWKSWHRERPPRSIMEKFNAIARCFQYE